METLMYDQQDVEKWCAITTDISAMRKGTAKMEDQQNEVVPRDFLCCPLCHEEFHEPKYIPCLHSFCKACIDDHIVATSNEDRSFACPVCATEILPVEEESIELPDNVFARRLSCPTTVHGKRDKSCGQCQASGDVSPVSTHCINCDEFLCGRCALNHLDQEETASHKTQKIENYDDGEISTDTSSQLPALPRCCQFYDALDIGTIYCVDCELLLCPECHTNAHREHRCAELGAISQNFEDKIKKPLKELQKDKNTLRKTMTVLEGARKYSAKNRQELKTAVKKRTEMLCNLIHEYETILVLEIDKRYSQNLAMIQEKDDIIHKHIESIKAVTDLTEKLLAFGSDEEKVSMRRKIGRRVRELCEEDLPSKQVQLTKCVLSEPTVTADTICEMFGELTKQTSQANKRKIQTQSHSIDIGVMNRRTARTSISSVEEVPEELADLEEYDEAEDTDMLSASNTSDALRPASSLFSASGNSNEDMKLKDDLSRSNSTEEMRFSKDNYSPRPSEVLDALSNNDSYQSAEIHDQVQCHNLEEAKKEMRFPETVISDCIKGVGVNHQGDIIVGTVSPRGSSKVFILEKHGIVRGQIPIEKNWGIHSIAADGKISLVVPRGENKYKVKVMSGENNIQVLADTHIESYGLNYVTATKDGKLLVTASRYAITNAIHGRSSKHGGNITVYTPAGEIDRVITNDTFSSVQAYLFDRPHCISVDPKGNFFVADPGRHSVIGFKANGEFMFEYGNTDAEEELYQGPDAICTDRRGNVIVFDKKDGRIDILNYDGHLQRCYFPSEHIRFISTTPDDYLLLVNSEGDMKFYEYN
ncbi:unnamed protein product [Lymnaea stagnalis]|uniref:Uncharacterized protein n=1 Tax=Lymnaea stagnalis TaxID=6523 RepID=A0AAV2HY43_LYMST